MDWPGRPSHSRRASLPWPTSSTRSPRRAPTAQRCRATGCVRAWSRRPGARSTRRWWPRCSACSTGKSAERVRQRARLPGLGLARASAGLVAAGAVLGTLLGAHLLVTASLTLGYGVRAPALDVLAPWVAYDLGGNVLTTEAFLRGALLDRVQRRRPFGAAAALVTAVCLARYLVDPLLPHSLEVAAGAVFYLTLLTLDSVAPPLSPAHRAGRAPLRRRRWTRGRGRGRARLRAVRSARDRGPRADARGRRRRRHPRRARGLRRARRQPRCPRAAAARALRDAARRAARARRAGAARPHRPAARRRAGAPARRRRRW